MKIKIEIEVELRDWQKARKLSLKEHVGEIEDSDDGTKFDISRSCGGIALMVSQKGTHREAIAGCADLVRAMATALVEHGAEIDGEQPPMKTLADYEAANLVRR